MKSSWIMILQEQGSIATKMADCVPVALGDRNLTFDQASRLHRVVEERAKRFDAIVERMQHEDLDDAVHEAAAVLEDVWSRLSVEAVNKVRDMRGLPAIDVAVEEDGDDESDRHTALMAGAH